MQWLWTWGGKCFGYLNGHDLWTHDGKHVAKKSGNEIYGSDGRYLGEIMSEDRLITNISKKSWRGPAFVPYGRCGAYAKYADYAGYDMYAGHEDFPPPESF